MGRLLLVGRLAARDLRRRPAEAALLLLAITAATAILTLGLALRGVISKPYQTTREATAGPDVVTAFGGPADAADVKALTDESGVVAHSGPYPGGRDAARGERPHRGGTGGGPRHRRGRGRPAQADEGRLGA